MTAREAIEFVKRKGFPYFKLYRGANRVATFEEEENAVEAFTQEIKTRNAGSYYVVVYNKINGSSAGDRFDFVIKEGQQMSGFNNSDNNDLYNRIEQQVMQKVLLEQMVSKLANIDEKLNTIASFLASNFEGKEDSLQLVEQSVRAFSLLKGLSGGGAATTTEAAKNVSSPVIKNLFG